MALSGLSAQYVDGQLVTNTSQTQKKETTKTAGSGDLDKDAFLQLLVAQMKYQDPLEPTSNTEYISQYATFSELEQMQNMSSNLTLSRASETVGKEVIIETRKENGETVTVQGYVEKVVYNGTKAYLSIDGTLYSIDDLKQVLDEDYNNGTKSVERINAILSKLPKVENLTMTEVGGVIEAYNLYNGLSEYQKTLLSKDTESLLDKYVAKSNELMENAVKEAQEANAAAKEENESNEEGLDEDALEALMKDQEKEEI